jgi:REP element-mobilizing transposase RayT
MPRSGDLRRGRFSEAGRAYLVTTITHGREPLFIEMHASRAVARTLMHMDNRGQTKTWAYVLMPDHLHWLLSLGDQTSLHKIMHAAKGYSGLSINRLLGRKGAVWQNGYHDHAVRSEEDLRELARYVVANPIRAGLVEKIGEYSHWDASWL